VHQDSSIPEKKAEQELSPLDLASPSSDSHMGWCYGSASLEAFLPALPLSSGWKSALLRSETGQNQKL
jgi:hypothetical protein